MTTKEDLYYRMGVLRGEINILKEVKHLLPGCPDPQIRKKEQQIEEMRKQLGLIT